MRRRRTASGGGVLLAVFAVLFQAILFGWHHHDPVGGGRLPATVLANPASPPQALDDEDGCEICQVLHHLFAAPATFVSPPPPRTLRADRIAGRPVFAVRSRPLAFHARAPPLA